MEAPGNGLLDSAELGSPVAGNGTAAAETDLDFAVFGDSGKSFHGDESFDAPGVFADTAFGLDGETVHFAHLAGGGIVLDAVKAFGIEGHVDIGPAG